MEQRCLEYTATNFVRSDAIHFSMRAGTKFENVLKFMSAARWKIKSVSTHMFYSFIVFFVFEKSCRVMDSDSCVLRIINNSRDNSQIRASVALSSIQQTRNVI